MQYQSFSVKNICRASALVLCLPYIGMAQASTTVQVDATTDIFLASQLSGNTVSGYFGTDTAPANSPVSITISAGNLLSFSATGSTSVDASCFAGPDGGCYGDESSFSPAPAGNTYKGPSNALIGVFLSSGVTSVADGLPSLDYTQAGNISLLSQSPSLNQIFFIGDGLTGTGTGAQQAFIAPTGATQLYLAVADSIGASTGNPGSLTVTYNVAPVPLPAAFPLFGLALAGLSGLRLRSKR